MFLNDRNAVDNMRQQRDANIFWIAITAVIAFTAVFSGIISSI